jgi:hypothetical protein
VTFARNITKVTLYSVDGCVVGVGSDYGVNQRLIGRTSPTAKPLRLPSGVFVNKVEVAVA